MEKTIQKHVLFYPKKTKLISMTPIKTHTIIMANI